MKNMNNKIKYDQIVKSLKKDKKFKRYEYDAKVKLNFGIELLRKRREQGLTQEEFAKKIETTQKVISKIENGDVDVGICMLCRISKALNFKQENFNNIFEIGLIYKASDSKKLKLKKSISC